MIEDDFQILQLCPAPDGIWAGVPLQNGSYRTQKVVGLALGVDDSGQQAVRLVTLDRSGEVEVSDSATQVFFDGAPDPLVFGRMKK